MSNKRILSKKQKFDLEMVYKPMLINIGPRYKVYSNLKDIKLFDVFMKYISTCIKDKDELFLFLSEYEDFINWDSFIYHNSYDFYDKGYLFEFLYLFKNNLDKSCWDRLSEYWYCYSSKEFIKRYKDYINWETISKYHRFEADKDFLIKMKDYIIPSELFISLSQHIHPENLIKNFFVNKFDVFIEYLKNTKEGEENAKS